MDDHVEAFVELAGELGGVFVLVDVDAVDAVGVDAIGLAGEVVRGALEGDNDADSAHGDDSTEDGLDELLSDETEDERAR